MNLIAQVSAAQRSASQKLTAQRFNEFGCTLCHRIVPGKMGLTELGVKRTHMHSAAWTSRRLWLPSEFKIGIPREGSRL
jgi:hypothetical protein